MKYFPTPNEHRQHTPHCGYDRIIKIFSQANALWTWDEIKHILDYTVWDVGENFCILAMLLCVRSVTMEWMHGLTRDTVECNSCWRITSIKKSSLRWISTFHSNRSNLDIRSMSVDGLGIDIVPKEIWSARNLRFARFLFTSKVGIICVSSEKWRKKYQI